MSKRKPKPRSTGGVRSKLTPEEFVLKAIRATRRTSCYNNGHLSTRLSRIAGAFRRLYGKDIDETLDRLIKEQKVWAMHVVWKADEGWRSPSRMISAECLEAFPDPHMPDVKNPTLYIDGKVPKRVLTVVERSPQRMLAKILAFNDEEAVVDKIH